MPSPSYPSREPRHETNATEALFAIARELGRVADAIREGTVSKDISAEDKASLNVLLQRSERFTLKMEALDNKNP